MARKRMLSPYRGKFKVSQIFKWWLHKGLDMVGLDDKNIYSTLSGYVEFVGWDAHYTGGLGLYVRIREPSAGWRYYFGHLSASYVVSGQKVGIGDLIGLEGNTGHSRGSHLHYEIRKTTDNTTFLNVSQISGIPNKLGVYEMKELTYQEALDILIDHKIIESPEYWRECGRTTFHVKELIISMANHLEGR